MKALLDTLLLASIKVTLLLVLVMLVIRCLRASPAALRRQVLTCSVVVSLVLPLWQLVGPSWNVSAPLVHRIQSGPVAHVSQQPLRPPLAPSRPVLPLPWAAVVVAIWGFGSLLLLALLACNLHRLHAMAKGARSLERDVHAGGTPVSLSRDCRFPCVQGLWRPRVLLPSACESWNIAELRAVLAHEQAHARRRDPLQYTLAETLCAVHWWNPIVWRIARRLRLEAELAADDVVLATGVPPAHYASQLLRLASNRMRPAHRLPRVVPTAVAALSIRIRSLLDRRVNRRTVRARTRGLIVLVSVCLAVPVAAARVVARDPWSLPGDDRPAIRDQWVERGSRFSVVVEGMVTPGKDLDHVRADDGARLFLVEQRAAGGSREMEFRGGSGVTRGTWKVDGKTAPIDSEARLWSAPLLANARDLLDLVHERRSFNSERQIWMSAGDGLGASDDPEVRHLHARIAELALERRRLIEDPSGTRSHAAQLAAERKALVIERDELRLRRALVEVAARNRR